MDLKRTSLLSAILLVGAASCSAGSDGGPADSNLDVNTTLGPVTTVAASDAVSTEPPAGTDLPMTVASSDAPTTAPSSAGDTTSSTEPATSTTEASAPSSAGPSTTIAPQPNGPAAIDATNATVFGVPMFTEQDTIVPITSVSDELGEPSSDTGFMVTPGGEACFGSDRFRVVRWGDLRMTFIEIGDGAAESTQQLLAWSVGDESVEQLAPDAGEIGESVPTGIITAEGIGVGSTREEARAAYGEQSLDGFADDRSSVFFPGSGSGALSFVFDGDVVAGIGNGPLDCAAADGEVR